MGVDALPEFIRTSNHLTGNQLAMLAGLAEVQEIDKSFYDERAEALLRYLKGNSLSEKLHEYARELIEAGKIREAWQVLLRYSKSSEHVL